MKGSNIIAIIVRNHLLLKKVVSIIYRFILVNTDLHVTSVVKVLIPNQIMINNRILIINLKK